MWDTLAIKQSLHHGVMATITEARKDKPGKYIFVSERNFECQTNHAVNLSSAFSYDVLDNKKYSDAYDAWYKQYV